MDHNPHLARLAAGANGTPAAKGSIERPADGVNIVWQTRAAPPSAFENALGDALEKVFESGATTLDEVVAGLNAIGFHSASGVPWTAPAFEAQMRALGGDVAGSR